MYDILVVGGGIAGASIAHALATDRRVCLVEAEPQPGLHATGRSAALFAPSYGGHAGRILTRASRAFFDDPPDDFGDAPLLKPRGCLYIARADQGEALTRLQAEVEESGGAVASLSGAEAAARVPLLRDDYVAAAAFDPDAMDIDVNALHQGFLRAGRRRGVQLKVSVGSARPVWSAGAWRLDTHEETIRAPVLVNAAGAWADLLAKDCGAKAVGLRPLRRTAVIVDPPPGVDVRAWPAVIDAEEQFYFKPDAGRLLLSPADETPDNPRDVYPDDLDVAIAVDRVQAAIALEVRRLGHSWAGLRTFAPDRAPVVGFDPEAPNFFWCAGQGGFGIQTAPAFARMAADLARGDPLPPDLVVTGLTAAEVSPERFRETPECS